MFENDWTKRIGELEAKVKEKDSLIRALKAVNEERLQIIERLQKDGYEEGKEMITITKTIKTHWHDIEVSINPTGTPVQIGNQIWKAFAYFTRIDRVKYCSVAAQEFRKDGYDFEYQLPAYS